MIHLPLRASMIKGEIKLFIILFSLPVAGCTSSLHTGILMVESGKNDRDEQQNFAAELNVSTKHLCKHINYSHEREH